MTFAQFNLDPQIAKAISLCGYKAPTPIQEKSIPEILQGRDVLACAQTGTGKTAAFVLPALQRIIGTKRGPNPSVLILTPTRELAAQITGAASQYGKFLRFNIVSLVGGMSYRQQIRSLSRPVDVIVATPGRLMDHMESGRVNLSSVEMLILDEADRMLDMGFIDDVKEISRHTPEDRQTLLFSATVDNRLAQVIRQVLKNPVNIDLSKEVMTPKAITQELYLADHIQHKKQLLQHFLRDTQIFKAIIFTATKINADKLADELCEMGFPAAALHGDLKQSQRNRTVESLRRGKIQFLVATDVAARGIDIQDITHVINFDLPKFAEDYVHRIGRTGRAGKTGCAISFAMHADLRHVERIERLMKQTLVRKVIEGLEPKKSSGSSQKKFAGKKKSFGGGGKPRKGKFAEKRSFNDKPRREKFSEKRSSDDKPRREKFADKRSFDDKPRREKFSEKRSFDDKPRREKFAEKRSFDDKPRREKFAEKRSFDDKPRREKFAEKRSFDSKPRKEKFSEKRSFDGKPRREKFSEKRSFDGKPRREEFSEKRSFDGKPRREEFSEKRSFDGKPRREKFSEKRSFDDKPRREKFAEKRSFDDKPRREKFSEKRSFNDKPRREKFSEKRSFDDKPSKGKFADKRHFDEKPRKSKSSDKRFSDDKPSKGQKFSAKPGKFRKKSKSSERR